MRLPLTSFLLLAATQHDSSEAFTLPSTLTPSSSCNHDGRSTSTQISMTMDFPSSTPSTAQPQKKVLKASDVIAKAKIGGVLTPDEKDVDPPKIFTEGIYDDFQSALLKLEKRVKGGAGSLSLEEVREFERETARIVGEMREFMADPEGGKVAIAESYGMSVEPSTPTKSSSEPKPSAPVATVVTPASPAVTSPPPPPPPAAVSPPATPTTVPPPETKTTTESSNIGYGKTDISQDEGPAFSGSGGFGLAKGTTNTYVIPGMEEMSPEEYRTKLQENISARQAKRREESLKNRGGVIGNMSSSGYLANLSRPVEEKKEAVEKKQAGEDKQGENVDVGVVAKIEMDVEEGSLVAVEEKVTIERSQQLEQEREKDQVVAAEEQSQQLSSPETENSPIEESIPSEQDGKEPKHDTSSPRMQSSEDEQNTQQPQQNNDNSQEEPELLPESASPELSDDSMTAIDDEEPKEQDDNEEQSVSSPTTPENKEQQPPPSTAEASEPTQPSFRSLVQDLAKTKRRSEVNRKSEWQLNAQNPDTAARSIESTFSSTVREQLYDTERSSDKNNWWDEKRQRPIPKTKFVGKPKVLPRSIGELRDSR